MRIAAIIPDWNGGQRLARTLASLSRQTRAFDEIIVVDDGSDPPTSCDPPVRVIRSASNRGFAAAVNVGIGSARSDLVAVLNNDVELADGWLDALARCFVDDAVWFAAGKCLNAARPELIDGSFDLVSRAACTWRAGAGCPDGPLWSRSRTISLAPMTAAVFRNTLFERVGGLDETFGSYLEDVDFGLRCASNGYTGVYEPGAVAYHMGSATLGRWSPRVVRQIARNQVLLVRRHYSGDVIRRYGRAIAAGQLLWGVLAARHGRLAAWTSGFVAGLRESLDRKPHHERIAEVVNRSEIKLYDLQQAVGFDWYWRLYFALAGRAGGTDRMASE